MCLIKNKIKDDNLFYWLGNKEIRKLKTTAENSSLEQKQCDFYWPIKIWLPVLDNKVFIKNAEDLLSIFLPVTAIAKLHVQ